MSIIELEQLVIGYDKPLTEPLNVSLSIGESVAIIGESGSGKTTLLNTMLGIVKPLSGRVLFGGQDLHKKRFNELAKIRGTSMAAVFQSGELLSSYTALQNVMLPRVLAKETDQVAESEARELLESLGVHPYRRAENLSGGERQRVALARALIIHPQVILADEPTGSLDVKTRNEVAQLLFDESRSAASALVVVTHDPVIADQADRLLEIEHVRNSDESKSKR